MTGRILPHRKPSNLDEPWTHGMKGITKFWEDFDGLSRHAEMPPVIFDDFGRFKNWSRRVGPYGIFLLFSFCFFLQIDDFATFWICISHSNNGV